MKNNNRSLEIRAMNTQGLYGSYNAHPKPKSPLNDEGQMDASAGSSGELPAILSEFGIWVIA